MSDDAETTWSDPAGEALDQTSLDRFIGDDAPTARQGLSVLAGGALVSQVRLPTLDIVVDRLSRLLTSSLRKLTSDNCDVTGSRSSAMRLGDFLNRISLPALIAVVRAEPWDGHLLVSVDSGLIGSLVDVMFGGRRNHVQPIEGRPYTQIELGLVERTLREVLLEAMGSAFAEVCEVEFAIERFEITPTYAAITELSAASVHFRAEVAMDGGRGGRLDFLLPYTLLEPVRDVLAHEFIGKKANGDPVWLEHLRKQAPYATVQLEAVLEERVISMAKVGRWAPGSLLVLDRRHDDLVELRCEGMAVARAMIGEHDGRVAMQIEQVMGEPGMGEEDGNALSGMN